PFCVNARRPVLRPATVTADTQPVVRRLPGNVGYVELPTSSDGDPVTFVGSVQRAMAAADSPPLAGWIVDLRRNRGGDSFRMLAAIGPLLGDGPVGGYQFARGEFQQLAYRDGDATLDGRRMVGTLGLPFRTSRAGLPVAVLTSRLTASAAEEVAVAFAGRAAPTRRFGEPTRGVPTLNRGVDLPSGSQLWVTTATAVDR